MPYQVVSLSEVLSLVLMRLQSIGHFMVSDYMSTFLYVS